MRVVPLLLLVFLAGCDRTSAGRHAYRQARFAEAHAAFAEASRAAGAEASGELLYDEALAALRAGDLAAADAALARVPDDSTSDMKSLCEFLRGNVAFARCELAARQAQTNEAEPFAWDVAIAHAESARAAWEAAATSRLDWPEARRNAERASLALQELRRRKAAADPKSKRTGRPEVRLRPLPSRDPPKKEAKEPATSSTSKSEDAPREPAGDVAEVELSPQEVRRLLDTLAAKERERLALRRSRRQATSAEVERDW